MKNGIKPNDRTWSLHRHRFLLTADFLVGSVVAVGVFVAEPRQGDALAALGTATPLLGTAGSALYKEKWSVKSISKPWKQTNIAHHIVLLFVMQRPCPIMIIILNHKYEQPCAELCLVPNSLLCPFVNSVKTNFGFRSQVLMYTYGKFPGLHRPCHRNPARHRTAI